jgi:PBP1b-binding outer membrane lipoprotein LpoB
MKLYYIFIILAIAMASCNSNTSTENPANQTNEAGMATADGMHQVVVSELIQTTSYTYLLVNENGKEYWIAVSRMDAAVGDEYYFADGLEMKDFKSKELDRVFESILFVQTISPTAMKQQQTAMESQGSKSVATEVDENIAIAPVAGGMSIADIYKNGTTLAGTKVKVRGKVMKVNAKIMGRNWIHIQDGSNFEGLHDLTLTTQELVEVGAEVTFEATVSIDKDFGGGYSYELILEDAVLK